MFGEVTQTNKSSSFIQGALSPESKLNYNSPLQSHSFLSPDKTNQPNQSNSPFIIKNSSYSNSKPMNFLTEKKRKISSSKLYTPSPNTNKSAKLSDRFIPMNKGINLMEKFNLANKYGDLDENCNNSNIDNTFMENNIKYTDILKQNVFNENNTTPFYNNKLSIVDKPCNKQHIKTKIFSFKSETKSKKNYYQNLIDIHNNKDDNATEQLTRKINTKPYKILKAPQLLDDFYLNLLDWSTNNDIAVGLGNSVGLWCTNQTQESILSTYDTMSDKYVSSVMWSQSGDHLAVGNSKGQIEIYDGK